MTGTGTFTSLGNPSKTTILQYEEEKLAVEFTASGAIRKGVPVKLVAATGKVIEWAKTDLQHLCIGIALSTQADGDLITIVTRGYAMVWGIAAAGTTNAGPATYNGYDTTNADTDKGLLGYSKYGAATDSTDAIAWILDPASGVGQLMRVVIKD